MDQGPAVGNDECLPDPCFLPGQETDFVSVHNYTMPLYRLRTRRPNGRASTAFQCLFSRSGASNPCRASAAKSPCSRSAANFGMGWQTSATLEGQSKDRTSSPRSSATQGGRYFLFSGYGSR